MDRRSGTGRGRKPEDKREGHGRANVGDREDKVYKRRGETGEEPKEGETVEEVKVEEPKVEEPKVIIKTEVIGVSMDDFFQGRQRATKKEAR